MTNGNIINLSSTNTSFQNIIISYLILDAPTQNSRILCQSKTSTNLLLLVPYIDINKNNPMT